MGRAEAASNSPQKSYACVGDENPEEKGPQKSGQR